MDRRGSNFLYPALAFIFTLNVVVNGRSLARRWYSGVYQNVTWECTQPGPMCSSCNQVSICVLNEHENGSLFYQQLQVDTCAADEGCNHLTARCNQRVGECYGGIKFRCHNPGIFPDPYDCNVYYTCGATPESSDPVVEYDYDKQHFCPWGKAFNSETEQCDLPDDADVCVYGPVPKCEKLFQTGSLQSNPNIYYTCVNVSGMGLQPKLFRCAGDETLDAERFVCRSKHAPSSTEAITTVSSTVATGATTTIGTTTEAPTMSTTPSTTTTESTTFTTTTTTTTETTTTTTEPTTTTTTEPTTTTTESTTTTTESTTTTTTEPTTTTTESTTTTTTEPTTTTTESTTSTTTEPTTTIPPSTTTGELVCTEKVNLPDPKDCHKYYRCDGAGAKPQPGTCMMGLGHFDIETKGCIFGGC